MKLNRLFALTLLSGTALAGCAQDVADEGDTEDTLSASEEISAPDEVVVNSAVVNDPAGHPLFEVKAMYSASQGKLWSRGKFVSNQYVRSPLLLAQVEHASGTTAAVSAAAPIVDGPQSTGSRVGKRACVSFTGYFSPSQKLSTFLRKCVFFDPSDTLSAPAPMVGKYYGISFYSGTHAPMDALIGGVSSLVSTAADRYAAGKAETPTFVTSYGAGSYTSTASIFGSLIAAGVLPSGQGPSFFATALDTLNGWGMRLRVQQICDVVGIKRSDPNASIGKMSFAFSNIALRGAESLLETERFDAEQVITAGTVPSLGWGANINWEWRVVKHDFARAEVSGVTSCSGPEAQAALQDMLVMQ